MSADTTLGWMAYKVISFTFARLHTMITVVSLGTNFGTHGPGPSRRTSTMAIVGSAFTTVLTLAMLRTIYAISVLRARCLTVLALPARSALAYTCYMMTFPAVFTMAAICAV